MREFSFIWVIKLSLTGGRTDILRKGAAVMGHVWGIGKREQEIWEGLGEKVMAIRQIGLVGG